MQLLRSLEIESVDLEGQGLARHEGKVVFVEDALLGEIVDVELTRQKPSYAKGRAVAWHRQSHQRVVPRCRHYGTCGGCAMQHLDASAQLAIKGRALEDSLWHLARLKPQQILAPLDSPVWGYRTRARLAARWVDKKGGLLLGFHERKSSYVAVMDSCEILPPRVSLMLAPLRDLIGSLSIARRIPQAELAVGDPDGAGRDPVIVWVLRILQAPDADDERKIREFADNWQIQIWFQTAGPSSARLFYPPHTTELAYDLPEFSLRMPFSPVDFTQVNPAVNELLVSRVAHFLECAGTDRVADFFCGLGNFTLALARRAGQVVGFEGSEVLVNRARENARHHGLEGKTDFVAVNLFEIDADWFGQQGRFDRLLLDPPREGAVALCKAMASLAVDRPDLMPRRIVYVSCNPATLARDCAILVHEAGYCLSQAGIVNMFPQTAHVESMAVLER